MNPQKRKFWLIHGLAFVLILMTWLAGAAIGSHAGTPLVALFYVLHIFPASIIFVLILFQWQISSQAKQVAPATTQIDHFNAAMHWIYDALLVALPLTGLLVFFDPAAPKRLNLGQTGWWQQLWYDRFFFHVHGWLFDALLAAVLLNLLVTGVRKGLGR
jgi:cytochrome b561